MRIVLRAYCCICRSLNTRIHCEQYACNALPRVLSKASQTMDMPFSSTVRLSSLATALPFAKFLSIFGIDKPSKREILRAAITLIWLTFDRRAAIPKPLAQSHDHADDFRMSIS